MGSLRQVPRRQGSISDFPAPKIQGQEAKMPCQRIESELDKTQSQPALKCGRVGGLCPGPREVLARMRALLYIRGQASLPPILYKSRATSEISIASQRPRPCTGSVQREHGRPGPDSSRQAGPMAPITRHNRAIAEGGLCKGCCPVTPGGRDLEMPLGEALRRPCPRPPG